MFKLWFDLGLTPQRAVSARIFVIEHHQCLLVSHSIGVSKHVLNDAAGFGI